MNTVDAKSRQIASATVDTLGTGEPTVIKNHFNNETFVFPYTADEAPEVAFSVMLDKGGTGGGNGLEHVHPLAHETFTVTAGSLKVVMAGKAHLITAGQTITIPPGTPHWFANGGEDFMEATVSFDPPQQHVRFFRNFAMLTQQKPQWFSVRGEPKLLLIALVLNAYHDHLYLAGLPVWLQKTCFSLMAHVARWRGYALPLLPSSSLMNIGIRACI